LTERDPLSASSHKMPARVEPIASGVDASREQVQDANV